MKIHVKIVHSTPVFPVIVLKQYKKKKKEEEEEERKKKSFQDFPGSPVEDFAFQCMEHGFYPCLGSWDSTGIVDKK